MSRHSAVETMLKKYGSTASLNGTQVKAVIRPLQIQSGADSSLTGGDSGLCYRYTGPAGCRLSSGDTLVSDGLTYSVRRSGTAVLGGEALYEWAVLKELPVSADTEIVLLSTDGTALAHAKGYESKILRDGCEIRSWGEGSPAEIGEGETSYELTLYDVLPENGISFSSLGEFLVEIRGTARTEAYSGCRVKDETEKGGRLLPPHRSLLILAAEKTEEAVS
ncbi:hypothetical protein EQM14_01260 [Caproiciproducens sp. NJN-50]|uniref:hypothetical protein n=1 Tax=Acutalibacteraceae TaxID=3082771 RepID=UPI000FFE1889|nr:MULTISPECIES: hypothetical protein [Acutalibacteraceae]QAT48515.1 hypothetical protein EQM14_01260 [Caproiciproducens sp. NJN-50]